MATKNVAIEDGSPAILFEAEAPKLAKFLRITEAQICSYYQDLAHDEMFLESINSNIAGVPEFGGKIFKHVNELRVFRAMLYVAVRAKRPNTMVETGVLNGFGSAFTLLAMFHNCYGTLHSIDIPPSDPNMANQGTTNLPAGKSPGWLIPDEIRSRHKLHFGRAEILLPKILEELDTEKGIDIFLHDSDHCYSHMMFEIALAWRYLQPGGLLLCDNVEQNSAFYDLARAMDGDQLVLQSFASDTRRWEHGLMWRNETR